MLSTFKNVPDLDNMLVPVAASYGGSWHCPMYPSSPDGWALVEVAIASHQIEAAKTDPRIIVCPPLFDPSPLPAQVITTYANLGATDGMSLGALLAMLADREPIFGQQQSGA